MTPVYLTVCRDSTRACYFLYARNSMRSTKLGHLSPLAQQLLHESWCLARQPGLFVLFSPFVFDCARVRLPVYRQALHLTFAA